MRVVRPAMNCRWKPPQAKAEQSAATSSSASRKQGAVTGVSFSCTGPIVGTVLIKSTQGEFWAPMVTMLAFSLAFALPFTLLAFFPSLIKKVRKSSGRWLGSVKVVLGFIELALGMKFLSTADQTYHWGLLDREVYLAIWIVIFSLLGFYLLGKIRFKHEEKVESIGVTRHLPEVLTRVTLTRRYLLMLIPQRQNSCSWLSLSAPWNLVDVVQASFLMVYSSEHQRLTLLSAKRL